MQIDRDIALPSFFKHVPLEHLLDGKLVRKRNSVFQGQLREPCAVVENARRIFLVVKIHQGLYLGNPSRNILFYLFFSKLWPRFVSVCRITDLSRKIAEKNDGLMPELAQFFKKHIIFCMAEMECI